MFNIQPRMYPKKNITPKEHYQQRRHKLIVEIIRADKTDIKRIITLQEKYFAVTEYEEKRLGRPKNEWWYHALHEYWERIRYCVRDTYNEKLILLIKDRA